MTEPLNDQEAHQPILTKLRWLKMFIPYVRFLVTGAVLIVGLGMAQRVGWISSGGGIAPVSGGGVEQTYTCSMCPQIRQPMPGRCPICGMELVVATRSGGDSDELAVHIDPVGRRLANIKTS